MRICRKLPGSHPVLSSRCMLFLTRVSSGQSLFVNQIFKVHNKLEFRLFDVLFGCFFFVVSIPTIWFICIYFASLPWVLSFVRSTIGKLSPRMITLSSSVSAACSICPSSPNSSGSSGSSSISIGW